MTECNGMPECERHPHIRQPHPSKPVSAAFTDGQQLDLSYSDAWEADVAAYESFAGSDVGKATFKSIDDALTDP